jgi:hypothetical protein
MGNSAETKNRTDLDLDLLSDEPKLVRLGGETIKVYPPTLKQLLGLQRFSTKLNDARDLDAVAELESELVNLIPAIEGKSLNLQQMIKLMEFVVEIAMPADVKELENRGITVSVDQKKTPSHLSENLPNSSTSTQDTQQIVS